MNVIATMAGGMPLPSYLLPCFSKSAISSVDIRMVPRGSYCSAD